MRRRHRRRRLLACALAVATGLGAGCFGLQRAAGCGDPGLFGCEDEPPSPPGHEEPPRPAPDETPDA